MTSTTTCQLDNFALFAAETVKLADDDQAAIYLVVGSGTRTLLCLGSKHYLQMINFSGTWHDDQVTADLDVDQFKQLANALAGNQGKVDPNQITITIDEDKATFEFGATTQIVNANVSTDMPAMIDPLERAEGGGAVQCTIWDPSHLLVALTSPAQNFNLKSTSQGLWYDSYHLAGAIVEGLVLS